MSDRVNGLVRFPKPPPASWAQAGILSVLGRRIVVRQTRQADRLFFIHQAGKVGSTSMVNAITSAGLIGFHTHQLNPTDRREIFRERLWKSWAPRLMWGMSPWVRRELQRRPANSVIITGIRNPIEHEISNVMQNPSSFLGINRRLTTDEEIGERLADIVAVVNRNLVSGGFDTWFQHELDYFLEESFPWEARSEELHASGHAHLRAANGLVAHVVRFEDLARAFAKIAEIEALPVPVLPHENVSNSSRVFDLVRAYGLSPDSIEAALSQRTIRAAYPAAQIEQWAAEWS